MKTYKVTMANGTVLTRKSNEEYTHAWLLTKNGNNFQHGFAKSFEKAQNQAKRWENFLKKIASERGEKVELETTVAIIN